MFGIIDVSNLKSSAIDVWAGKGLECQVSLQIGHRKEAMSRFHPSILRHRNGDGPDPIIIIVVGDEEETDEG